VSRVALVTGGTRGIGLAMVRELRLNDIKVAVVGRGDAPKGCDLFIKADLRNDLYLPHGNIVERVADKFGRMDILVNNAGAQNPAGKYLHTEMKNAIELMVLAPFELSKQAANIMFNSGGHIVNILSTAAFQGARNIVGYVAAKHALLGLTRALAIEWAPLIHVNAIAPGLTDTDMVKDMAPERRKLLESITPSGRFGKPEEVADALMYLINSTNVYGQTIVVDGGWLAKNG